MSKKQCIYLVHDLTTNKGYIGATKDLVSRFFNHRKELRNNEHHNKELQEAYNKGNKLESLFVEIDSDLNPFEFEKSLIQELHPEGYLYNVKRSAGERKISPEGIERIRQAHKGKTLSQEHRDKISKANVGKNIGKVRTEEHIENSRQAHAESHGIPVSVDGIVFRSIAEVARFYNIHPSTVQQRIESESEKFSSWCFAKKEGSKNE